MSEAPARGTGGGAEGSDGQEGADRSSPIRRMSLYAPPRSTRHTARRRRGRMLAVIAAAIVLVGVLGAAAVWALTSGPGAEEPAGPVPESFVGSWKGDMVQENAAGGHVTDWGAQVELESGEERGSSEWYTLGCRGSLTLTEREEDRLVFDYAETYDPEERCVDASVLILTPAPDGSALEARWEAVTHDGTTMISTGTLR